MSEEISHAHAQAARVAELRAALTSLSPWTEAVTRMTDRLSPDDTALRDTETINALLDLMMTSRALSDLSVRLTRAVAAYLVLERGLPRATVAAAAGVTRQALGKWITLHQEDPLDPRDRQPENPFEQSLPYTPQLRRTPRAR